MNMIPQRRSKEEYVVILDYLHHGYLEDSRPMHRKEPMAQGIGKSFFTLLELVPSVQLKPHDEVYIGEGKRDKIAYIKGTLSYDRLTQTAKAELPSVIARLIGVNEKLFVQFFNMAGPISLRAHQLELLPGVGKKHAQSLVDERQKKPFESFEDIKKRVPAVDPVKVIIDRILIELQDKDRHRLFVRR
jgi:putative nucleotide binding protein